MIDMAARNARALERLRALGETGGPLQGAEYRLRIAQGRERGLTTAQAAGKAARAKLPSITELRAGRVIGAPTRDLPGGAETFRNGVTVTSTTHARTMILALRRASKRGRKVTIGGKVDTAQGVKSFLLGGGKGVNLPALDDSPIVGSLTVRTF